MTLVNRCPKTEPAIGGGGLMWVCRREAGHAGPCAAELASGECGHRAPGHALPCPLPAGHEGAHTMSPCPEWWKPAPGIATPCQLYSGHAGQHFAEVRWQ